MKHILTYSELLNESKTSDSIVSLIQTYKNPAGDHQSLGAINGIKVVSINRDKLAQKYPEWEEYLGSHHWGKGTKYIPEDTIWIAQGLSENEFIRVVNHELIEREAMRALEDNQGMTPEQAWEVAHNWVKSIGF